MLQPHCYEGQYNLRVQMKTVVLLGPDLKAVSGVSSHLSQILGSHLAREFRLVHFQVGSEGRSESRLGRLQIGRAHV